MSLYMFISVLKAEALPDALHETDTLQVRQYGLCKSPMEPDARWRVGTAARYIFGVYDLGITSYAPIHL